MTARPDFHFVDDVHYLCYTDDHYCPERTDMTSLPPYSGDGSKTCAKCGNSSAYTEFVPESHGSQAERVSVFGAPMMDEYMKRECTRCGYTWAEACA